jgi:phage terminase small subunit
MPVTPKQARFVEEYLTDLNATQAAIRAGYSKKTAEQLGYQLLHKTSVAEAIEKARAKLSEKTEITQEYVLRRLKREAELEGDGASHSARVSALEKLGKHLKMFTDVSEINPSEALMELLGMTAAPRALTNDAAASESRH